MMMIKKTLLIIMLILLTSVTYAVTTPPHIKIYGNITDVDDNPSSANILIVMGDIVYHNGQHTANYGVESPIYITGEKGDTFWIVVNNHTRKELNYTGENIELNLVTSYQKVNAGDKFSLNKEESTKDETKPDELDFVTWILFAIVAIFVYKLFFAAKPGY